MAPWVGALKGAYLRGPLPRPPPDELPVVLGQLPPLPWLARDVFNVMTLRPEPKR